MRRLIDLSWEVAAGMPVFPGDREVEITCFKPESREGYFVSRITLGTHIGTHVDAPKHKLADGRSIDNIPLDCFIAKALVIDLSYLKPLEEIKIRHLEEYETEIKECRAILLRTNWSEHYTLPDFYDEYPSISIEAAKWLCDLGIRLAGMESPSVHPVEHVQVHEVFLKNNVVLVESICNLKQITNRYVEFYSVPLKMKGLDGCPVRAFAIEEIEGI